MRIAEDYLRLRMAFPECREGETFRVSMEDLSRVLFCTPRNAKLIVTKMIECNWVRFLPGRGRGHTSELTFLVQISAVLLNESKERVRQGDVQGAFDWLKANETLDVVRPQFLEWLTAYFGYEAAKVNGDRVVETLRLPIYRQIVSLDPANAMYAFDTHLIHQIFSRLVEYDAKNGEISKGLAHHWESNADATVWTFYLYKGIRFHDGRELTAGDIQASLMRLRNHSCTHSWLAGNIERIEISTPYTVKILLYKPNRRFLFYMSHSAASIVPSVDSQQSADQTWPVGSGPYRIIERRTGKCVLEAFPSYFGYPCLIDRIEVIIVPENEAEACFGTSPGVLTVVTGEFHVPSIPEMPLRQTITGISMLTINVKKQGILQNLPLRQALVQGIDRNRMIRELGETRVCPATGLRLEQDPDMTDFFYSPQEARNSLNKSGYDGQPLQLYTFERHAPDAYWLKEQYKAFGIRIEVNIVPWAKLIEPSVAATADLILFEAVLSEGPIRLLEYLQSSRSFIRNSLSEEVIGRIDNCTNAMLSDTEDSSEKRWLAAVERELNKACACLFLVTRSVRTVYQRSLQGVEINSKGWVDFHSIWFHEIRY